MLTKKDIVARRVERYRRRMDLRITTPEQAVEFVNAVGFCFLFPIQNVELPSLWDAIAGRVVPTSAAHSGYEIERTWGWKDAALDKKVWFYAKLLRGKATLVSLDLLPHFYALSDNYGDYENDYREAYAAGRLSAEARAIYQALLQHGPLDAVRLRHAARLDADAAKARYDRALTELQKGLKVLPVGIAQAGAWRYAFIYELLPRWFPALPAQARALGRGQARRTILACYLRNVIAATLPQAARLLGWPLADTWQAAEALEKDGQLVLNVPVAGLADLQMVTKI